MSNPISTIPAEIERDRWGRPLVTPPGGGQAIPYTRCTTFVDAVEDKYNLQQWELRMVALGLANRSDYVKRILTIGDPGDDRKKKSAINAVTADAKEFAKASTGATTGTWLHTATERIDRGQDPGVIPEEHVRDITAYTEATADLKAVAIEQFTVLDQLRIGGTPDRVVSVGGKRYIADLKTGSISYGFVKIAAQLAVYSRSKNYDLTTGERTEHGADLTRGIIIHLPAGTGECRLYWIDLVAGWEAVKVARRVRELRARAFGELVTPYAGEGAADPANPALDLAVAIKQAPDRAEVEKLWRDFAAEWTAEHTALAKAQIASLGS